MIVVFKNGETLEVSVEMANIIRDSIIKGTGTFQCFTNEETENTHLIVNISEILYIKTV